MTTNRMIRVNELLKREIAEDLYRVVHEQDFDLSAVTVTHVITSTNLRHARVLVSIRGDDATRKNMLNKMLRHRKEIQHRIGRHVKLKYTPHLFFELDESIAEGDRVLHMLDELEDAELTDDESLGETRP